MKNDNLIVPFQMAQIPTMVAEYREKLIPQDVLQRSLEEFIEAIGQ